MSKKSKHSRQPGQNQSSKPQWQPIEMLPTFTHHIDSMLEADREQYQTLLEAKDKPHVLDDYTVNRVKSVFTTQREDFSLFDEQLKRWVELPTLTDEQRSEVTRLQEQMRLLRENNTAVLALAEELSKGTIDKMMSKSDAELGLEFLLREFKL